MAAAKAPISAASAARTSIARSSRRRPVPATAPGVPTSATARQAASRRSTRSIVSAAGPGQNAKGAVIATDIENLHGANNLTKQTALTEKGEIVKGRGDKPNMHDILTGSQTNGLAFPPGRDMTCGNWTKSGAEGSAQVGHGDRQGITDGYFGRGGAACH